MCCLVDIVQCNCILGVLLGAICLSWRQKRFRISNAKFYEAGAL